VSGNDEGASDTQASRGVAERGLDRRLVAARDCGSEAEVAGQQLRRILELVRPLLPQAVINGAARLKLALDLARRSAGNEARQRRGNSQHRRREQQRELDREASTEGAERAHAANSPSWPSPAATAGGPES